MELRVCNPFLLPALLPAVGIIVILSIEAIILWLTTVWLRIR